MGDSLLLILIKLSYSDFRTFTSGITRFLPGAPEWLRKINVIIFQVC